MKILIIQQKMIGDVLTTSILFEALRREYPEAELHYLIFPHTRHVVENNPFIDKLILFEDSDKNPLNFISFLQKIKKEKYEAVIDVYSKIGTALISAYSGAKTRISYHKWYTRFLYSNTFNYKTRLESSAGFAIENRMLLLQGISFNFPVELKPKIYLEKAEILSSGKRLEKSGVSREKPLYMISVMGSSKNKTYPLEYLAVLLDQIVEKTQAQLLFNYIPSQSGEILRLYSRCKPLTQKHIFREIFGESLREFMALTYHCDSLIGNEGGAINMAKALNIPTFSIFSPKISKDAWSLYEDETNVAVHLKDYLPKSFEEKNTRKLDIPGLYEIFSPELIWPKLVEFLEKLSIKND